MSPVLRMRVIVGLAAVAAAAVVAGVVYATRQDPKQPSTLCRNLTPAIVSGVASNHVQAVRAAFAKGPKRAALALETLAQENPTDPVLEFNEATALYCAGYVDDATAAFRQAKKAGRNTVYAVRADNLLHPQFFQKGYPIFQYGGTDPLLVAGIAQQRAFHQVSAERLYARAARLHPESPDAQVAAAVARFDMDNLSASFSRLGPLVRRFPKSQSVRFHLGYLLAWTGQRSLAVQEFRAARALGPHTKLGQDSDSFLQGLTAGGTGTTKR